MLAVLVLSRPFTFLPYSQRPVGSGGAATSAGGSGLGARLSAKASFAGTMSLDSSSVQRAILFAVLLFIVQLVAR